MRGEDFPRLLPRMQKTPLQWGYGEDSCILSTEKLAEGGTLLLFSHLSRATIGHWEDSLLPSSPSKTMASSTERISQNYIKNIKL